VLQHAALPGRSILKNMSALLSVAGEREFTGFFSDSWMLVCSRVLGISRFQEDGGSFR
jgi:hypothetical protein